jgi:hypothetical protein
MMRTLMLIAGACLVSSAAAADTVINVPNDAQRNYCIYNGKVFSVGSLICIGNGRGETCEAGEGNARARWARTKDAEMSETCLDVRPEPMK